MDNRRKHQRFRAAVAAEVEIDSEVYEGETRDLSAGGASIAVRGLLPDDAEVALTLFLTEDGIEAPDVDPLHLQAQVIWLSEPKEGSVLAGIRFVSPTPDQLKRIDHLLSVLQPA